MDGIVITKPPMMPPLAPPLPPPIFQTKSTNNNQHKIQSTNSLRSKHSSTNSNGFRLMDDQNDTGSIYSIYKQKIDAMFESDSGTPGGATKVPSVPTTTTSNQKNAKNPVQARIEKMFTDVAKDTGVPINDSTTNSHIFSVDYLGSVQLYEKVTSLDGLQIPLKDLYFTYKKKQIRMNPKVLTGRLEISNLGLKIQYQGDKGDLEQMNSFPTIAVWSAVKFVMQNCSGRSLKYAFLPLITDPDNFDKTNLFRQLDENDKRFIRIEETHSPLFAVVMRKIGVQKQLECHGFVCQTSEDAIVIAATLYKSLMAHMEAKEMRPKNRNGITCMSIASSTINEKSSNIGGTIGGGIENGVVPVRPPRKKRSTTSSTISETENLDTSDTQPLIDKRNQKKSTKTRRAPKTPDDMNAILPYEEPINNKNEDKDAIIEIKPKSFSDKISTYMSREQKQITAEIKQVMSGSTNRGLKHVPTLRRPETNKTNNNKDNKDDDNNGSPNSATRKENSGDILTKVTIPRSGSFLNAGGLTRYKSKVSRGNGQATGGSPLGFNELFNEFRLQEGLHSMDEILGVIIDPDGMSFNDLKPIYKEFLLKLSVTLTKDELYQRSKMIMRRHRKKMLKKNNQNTTNNNNNNKIFVNSRFKRLKHIFQKKLKIRDRPKRRFHDIPTEEDHCKLPESSISTSSYDTRHFIPKQELIDTKKDCQKNRRKSSDFRISTSEDSDFFSLRRKSKPHSSHTNSNNQHRNSSSGYVSCSECSYDSDTCTCTSADKCYCSLGHNHNHTHSDKHNINNNNNNNNSNKNKKNNDGTLTYCGCDTDSCTDSNKCYCSKDRCKQMLFEKKILGKMKNKNKKKKNCINNKKLCKKISNSHSTRSLEYMHNPIETYYEKLLEHHRTKSMQNYPSTENNQHQQRRYNSLYSDMPIDYDMFNRNHPLYSCVFNDVEKQTKTSSVRSYGFNKHRTKGSMLQSATADPENCFDALSVKKSAEIAALFSDMKLSQTTDIKHLKSQQNHHHHHGDEDDADLNSIVSSKNLYNRLKTQNSFLYNSHYQNNIATTTNQKMIQNTLYGRNSLYSAQNGLYTIQSQSDESIRSSFSNGDRSKSQKKKKSSKNFDYYQLESPKTVSNSLENSLGYLP